MVYQGVEAFLNNLTTFLEKYMYIFTLFSALLNTFHILILTRKSMTSSAVTSLLIGIAVVDIVAPIYYVETGLRDLVWSSGYCTTPHGHLETMVNWILQAIRDDLRRCSTWFGLDLAVIRMVALKLALKKRCEFITRAPFGRRVMLVTFVLSSAISVFFFYRYQVVVDTNWHPKPGCEYTTVEYMVDEIDADSKVPGHAREAHLILTAVFEKILPSILFPIVGAALVWELRKTTKLVEGNAKSISSAKSTEKTNKLVIYMTITFIIIELPIGVCKLITATRDTYEDAIISESITKLLNMIYIPLAATHCLICFSMSSQYRSTVKRVLGLEKKTAKVHAVVSSVAIQSN